MPPKRAGKKRKATTSSSATTTNGDSTLAPPDRATWPGWVEMESEPAFFNIMLSEMGVKGIKVQEVYDMDEAFLLTLPQPVHALIFLFRYRETDESQQDNDSCPEDVWFANQTPDFACATFALLNIVNNIPGLDLGAELQKFRDFTQDMDPLSRGDAIDSFDFVKRIHNSFARDNDLLQADMHMKSKASKFRKRQTIAKANATKAAKKAELAEPKTPLKEKSPNASGQTRTSDRTKRASARKSPKESSSDDRPDDDEYKASAKTKARATPDQAEQLSGLRRSKRELKPRKEIVSAAIPEPEDEEGFHFAAYMPINGNVWKLDGLDRFPSVVGPFSEDGGGWMQIAQPHLVGRMEQYAASEIQFNLMAIVHDPLASERTALIDNIKSLQAIDKKLDAISDDWRSMEDAETKLDVVTDSSPELAIATADIDAAALSQDLQAKIDKEEDLLKLNQLRKEVIIQQLGLRAAVRDSLEATRSDEEKARHRRHDYSTFVRSWLGALADEDLLTELLGE